MADHNHIVTPGWQWPREGQGRMYTIPDDVIRLERDRDELAAALGRALDRCNCDGASPFDCAPCVEARAILARIKGGG